MQWNALKFFGADGIILRPNLPFTESATRGLDRAKSDAAGHPGFPVERMDRTTG